MLQHLDNEQRVAFRVSGYQSCQRRRRITADPRFDDVADVIVREPMEGDSRGTVFSAQRLQQVAKLRRPLRYIIAMRDHNADRRVAGRADHVSQEQQGAPVGPMQVVDNQENRCTLRCGRKQLRRGLEQAVAAAVRRRRARCFADVNWVRLQWIDASSGKCSII